MRVGETMGSVKILSINAPWSVRIAWSGGEYEVPLWGDRTGTFFSSNPFEAGATPPGLRGESDLNPRSPIAAGGTTRPPVAAGSPPSGSPPASPGAAPGRDGPRDAPPGAVEPDGPGVDPEEFVPVAALPAALDEAQIESMSRDEARAALSRVARARGGRLDPQSSERLRQEFEWLLARLRRGD